MSTQAAQKARWLSGWDRKIRVRQAAVWIRPRIFTAVTTGH